MKRFLEPLLNHSDDKRRNESYDSAQVIVVGLEWAVSLQEFGFGKTPQYRETVDCVERYASAVSSAQESLLQEQQREEERVGHHRHHHGNRQSGLLASPPKAARSSPPHALPLPHPPQQQQQDEQRGSPTSSSDNTGTPPDSFTFVPPPGSPWRAPYPSAGPTVPVYHHHPLAELPPPVRQSEGEQKDGGAEQEVPVNKENDTGTVVCPPTVVVPTPQTEEFSGSNLLLPSAPRLDTESPATTVYVETPQTVFESPASMPFISPEALAVAVSASSIVSSKPPPAEMLPPPIPPEATATENKGGENSPPLGGGATKKPKKKRASNVTPPLSGAPTAVPISPPEVEATACFGTPNTSSSTGNPLQASQGERAPPSSQRKSRKTPRTTGTEAREEEEEGLDRHQDKKSRMEESLDRSLQHTETPIRTLTSGEVFAAVDDRARVGGCEGADNESTFRKAVVVTTGAKKASCSTFESKKQLEKRRKAERSGRQALTHTSSTAPTAKDVSVADRLYYNPQAKATAVARNPLPKFDLPETPEVTRAANKEGSSSLTPARRGNSIPPGSATVKPSPTPTMSTVHTSEKTEGGGEAPTASASKRKPSSSATKKKKP